MKRDQVLLNLIKKTINKEELTVDELKLQFSAKKSLNEAGRPQLTSRGGGFLVPLSLSADLDHFDRDILTEDYMLRKKKLYILDPIAEKSVFVQAGATFLQSEMGDLRIPSLSGILVSWPGDGSEPSSDGDEIAIRDTAFQNKRVFICLDVDYKTLIQGGDDMEAWLRDRITTALAASVDSIIGGIAASGGSQPQGIGYAITTGALSKRASVSPVYTDLVTLEEAAKSRFSAADKYAFITSMKGKRILRGVDSNGGSPALHQGKLLDWPLFVSSNVSDVAGSDGLGSLLMYGAWPDLGIVQMGAYDILVDPFTLKKSGKVQLTVNAYFDVKGLNGTAVTEEGEDATEVNYYTNSFSCLPIKP